jgi:CheY-like chemotaxis protein
MGIQVFYDRWGIDTIERMVKALPLDLIFLDLHFPHGVTGYIIFEKMQAKPNLKNIPTVILSASDPDIEIKKAQSMGFSGFISRPIRRESFERQLKRIFSGGTVWGDYPF